MKLITVPKTLDAMSRLNMNSCLEDDLVEIELINIEYDKLWKSGFFNALNYEIGLMIDDFEDESIVYENINQAIVIVDRYYQKSNEKDNCIYKIKSLFELAYEKKTGVYFFF